MNVQAGAAAQQGVPPPPPGPAGAAPNQPGAAPRSMSIALPGSRGLFSLLQEAFRSEDNRRRIKLTDAVHAVLDDFRWLQRQLVSRPTRLYELVPLPPTLLGAHDAAGHGAGGVGMCKNSTGKRRAAAKLVLSRTHTACGGPSEDLRITSITNTRGRTTDER